MMAATVGLALLGACGLFTLCENPVIQAPNTHPEHPIFPVSRPYYLGDNPCTSRGWNTHACKVYENYLSSKNQLRREELELYVGDNPWRRPTTILVVPGINLAPASGHRNHQR